MKDMALIVFVKNFQLGKVKTRLGKAVGDSKALEIYIQLCTFTVMEVNKTGLPVYFYFSDYIDNEFLKRTDLYASENRYLSRVQKGENLGIRMQHAFEEVLKSHETAFILGTDCPYFQSNDILTALHQLQSKDIDLVIGPAVDGGYYGLGMKRPWDLFTGVDWSTDQVVKQTIDKIEELNLRFHILQTLNDMDYESDWNQFQNSSAALYFQEVIRSSSSASDTLDE